MKEFITLLNDSTLLKVTVLIILTLIFLAIGSFLNVLIYRLPIGESLVKKHSFCPKCKHQLRWYENIPLVSFIIQGGKCRSCKEKISIRYLVVEFLSVVGLYISYFRFGFSLEMIIFALLLDVFIVIFSIDFKHQIIPDSLNITIFILALLLLFFSHTSMNEELSITFIDKLLGVGVVFVLVIIIYLSEELFNKELLGGGDIKLFFAIALFMGWQLFLLGLFASAVVGLIMIIITKIVKKNKSINKQIPFGPYLTIGFSFAYIFGLDLINQYLTLFI